MTREDTAALGAMVLGATAPLPDTPSAVRDAFRPIASAAGERHARLMTVASTLLAHGLPRDAVLTLVRAVNASLCRPPKAPRDVERLVGHVAVLEERRQAALAERADAFVRAHGTVAPLPRTVQPRATRRGRAR